MGRTTVVPSVLQVWEGLPDHYGESTPSSLLYLDERTYEIPVGELILVFHYCFLFLEAIIRNLEL